MRICIHRGSKQIGGSCVELENHDQRLLIDFGLPLDAESNNAEYLPDIKGLDGNDPTLLGILISHPHLDHFGLLAHISPKIPVGMGVAARRILTAASPFLPGNWPIPAGGWDFVSGQRIDIGQFEITPFLMDHSAYDAYALLIECESKRIFYTGDIRAHGRKSKLFEILVNKPPADIDVLLMEGSSLGRLEADQHFPTESQVEADLVKIFSDTKGMALVHASSQNIDRLVSVMRACKRTGRRLIIDLYTAAILEATGNQNIPQSNWPDVALFIPYNQRIQIKNNAWFELLKRHSTNRIFIENLSEIANRSVLLFRSTHRSDLERGNCLDGASYTYSQWEGYWEKEQYVQIKNWLEKRSIPMHHIHTSGHASPLDLKRLVSAINPRKVVPIHTFFPERYNELFVNVEFHHDGERWEI
jgi:ribonuclease J